MQPLSPKYYVLSVFIGLFGYKTTVIVKNNP